MRILILTASLAAIATSVVLFSPFNSKAKAQEHPEAIGACYTLFDCQGSSIGVLSDEQCRSMGGHSMLNGGICIEL
jgi:hypothetical protein